MMNRLKPPAFTPASAMGASLGTSESLTGRKKVTLSPGHSLMDWIRLGRTQGDLSGVGSDKKLVTVEELAMHNMDKDIWMAIRGKVYNVTPYMEYHPGGTAELMRAAGKDGTELFDEIHNWVNVESMMDKCLVGTLVLTQQTFKTPTSGQTVRPRQASVVSTSSVKPSIPKPTQDWYQTDKELVIVIYTKWENMTPGLVIVDCDKTELCIQALVKDFSYFVHFKPSHSVGENCKVSAINGKVEVRLLKKDVGMTWATLGRQLSRNDSYSRTKNFDVTYREWTLSSNETVTHDTKLLRFTAPSGCKMVTPIGYHIHIKHNISGMEIARSYTVVDPSLLTPDTDPEVQAGKAIYLMIKSYSGGAISPWICSLSPGSSVMLSSFDGHFDVSRLSKTSHLVMFAAGTGFTSMIRLITHSLYSMTSAKFPVVLLFYNKTQKDILWRDQLEMLEEKFKPRFTVHHILSQETESTWKGLRGRVNPDHVKQFVPTPTETPKTLICICGQWAYNDVVETFVKQHGFSDQNIHVFSQTS